MNIFEASEDGFAKCDRDTLKLYAETLGVPVGNSKDDTLRQKLLEKLGRVNVIATDSSNRPLREIEYDEIGLDSIDEIFKLDLTGRGPWGGRRRIIKIAKPDEYEGLHPQFIGWGRQKYWIRYDAEVSVPYPVRNLMANTTVKKYVRGQPPLYKPSWRQHSRFRFSDLRDDPATANLPVSQKHQFRVIAQRTDNFREFGANEVQQKRNLLKMIGRATSIQKTFRRRYGTDLREQDIDMLREALLGYIGVEEGLEVDAA